MLSQHVDVLIIGAGLSGIGTAYHIQDRCPSRSYAILEARDAIGGTWDLFRYPGVRSDSDMYTFGYSFRPWTDGTAFASGDAIRRYIRETAEEFGIDEKIRFQHRMVRASWSSAEAQWTVDVEVGPERRREQLTCNFLYTCTGYYDYEQGYTPDWPSLDRFAGRVVHPQQWPEDLDLAEKEVVVIGSGATAVTLVPAIAGETAHVTMLQRSPSYVAAQPEKDVIANLLRRLLPEGLAHRVARWKNVLRSIFYYEIARRFPDTFRRWVMDEAQAALGDQCDVEPHFDPDYDPWDQRLCIAPDGDLFAAIRSGQAAVVTDHVEHFTEAGIQLRSGRTLDADVIVTATGLRLRLLHGVDLFVDGEPVDLAETMTYKGSMFSGIPNLAVAVGYTNASWTLKTDLSAVWVCRLLNHMEREGYAVVTPRRDPSQDEAPVLDLDAGYIQRAIDRLPAQGAERPWRLRQNYVLDLMDFRLRPLDDGVLEFEREPAPVPVSSR
jgi:monooxygenase